MSYDLKTSYHISQDLLDEMRKARSAAVDGLHGGSFALPGISLEITDDSNSLRALLDEAGQYARASEFKAPVSELQQEIVGCKYLLTYSLLN